MADGLNRVTLIGNLCADPELRSSHAGQAILNMRLATSESWFDKASDERKERTEFHTIVMWGKRGDALSKFLSKGSKLCAEGRLQTRSWEDKQGAKRYTTEVVASNIILLGGGKTDGGGGQRGGGGGQYDDGPAPKAGGGDGFGDDDIPF